MLKLTSQAARVAFILAVIDTVKHDIPQGQRLSIQDLEDIAEAEVQKRPRFKPCMAENIPFASTIEAVRYLAHHRRDLWENSKAAQRYDAHAVMENLRNTVKRWCNADNRFGYYWI